LIYIIQEWRSIGASLSLSSPTGRKLLSLVEPRKNMRKRADTAAKTGITIYKRGLVLTTTVYNIATQRAYNF
jgi:hypothetical protein